ncbi:hypothetical protein HGRIS_006930 [Hohenbuehelia grisea]|uniref:Uncharacterized protein n=1 Tax=Hohenbuehelia grisea TaxID=104357 RepID=A0ABR3JBN2_9AGAR
MLIVWPYGAGCIWNDILDRDFDAKVERTKTRPLASGQITVFGALVFLLVHLSILVAMVWDSNEVLWRVSLLGIFPLPGIYPLMKRIMYWPNAWLGVAINIGVPIASAALTGQITKSAQCLLFACWSWTVWYDTIYAAQDKRDDITAGVKSSAILFEPYGLKNVLSIFGLAFVGSLVTAGVLNGHGLPFYLAAVGCGGLHLAIQLYHVDLDSPKSCHQAFESNGYMFGFIIWSGFFLDYILSNGGILA